MHGLSLSVHGGAFSEGTRFWRLLKGDQKDTHNFGALKNNKYQCHVKWVSARRAAAVLLDCGRLPGVVHHGARGKNHPRVMGLDLVHNTMLRRRSYACTVVCCLYVYIYIYMVPPPGTYLFEEFTGICSVFTLLWALGRAMKKKHFQGRSGSFRLDLNRFKPI